MIGPIDWSSPSNRGSSQTASTRTTASKNMKFFAGLGAEQLELLTRHQIVFDWFSLAGLSGILLDEEATARAASLLELSALKERQTEFDGIVSVSYECRKVDAASASQARSQLDAEHEKFKAQYVAACSARQDELFDNIKDELLRRRQVVEQLQNKLILELRAEMIAERKAKGLSAFDREALLAEYDALLAAPKVRKVTMDAGIINVYTDMLQCSSPDTGKLHDIGEFLIKIYLDGQADGVRWFNLTRTVDAARLKQQAPLVLTSGRALFSDTRGNFPDLIAQMQFAAAAMLAVSYIEQIAGEDPGAEQVNRWPLSGP